MGNETVTSSIRSIAYLLDRISAEKSTKGRYVSGILDQASAYKWEQKEKINRNKLQLYFFG